MEPYDEVNDTPEEREYIVTITYRTRVNAVSKEDAEMQAWSDLHGREAWRDPDVWWMDAAESPD